MRIHNIWKRVAIAIATGDDAGYGGHLGSSTRARF